MLWCPVARDSVLGWLIIVRFMTPEVYIGCRLLTVLIRYRLERHTTLGSQSQLDHHGGHWGGILKKVPVDTFEQVARTSNLSRQRRQLIAGVRGVRFCSKEVEAKCYARLSAPSQRASPLPSQFYTGAVRGSTQFAACKLQPSPSFPPL